MPAAAAASAQRRIANLAALTPVHRALYWLHLHQPQLREWLHQLVRIPAPPFGEGERAAWFLERFRELGLEDVGLDAEGNALGVLAPSGGKPQERCLLLSAHLDTVFPAGTDCATAEEGSRILAPGVCDNGAGLSALLATAAALQFARIRPPLPIVFAANVGEEGEGDLRGMRFLFERGAFAGRIAGAIALEGSGSSTVVTRGLGSLRLRATITGPGGHSWSDFGEPNPILLLSRGLAAISEIALPSEPRTTLNAGLIHGGTSINSIPETASVLLDIRSTETAEIHGVAAEIEARLMAPVAEWNLRNAGCSPATLKLEIIGERPPGSLPDDAPLLGTVRAVDRHLGLRTELRIGSTDANLPLSRNIPAVALGTGGVGGGIHTLAEWYDPSGREIALRRILLTLLDTADVLMAEASGSSLL